MATQKSSAPHAHPSTREQRGLALYRERSDEIKHVRCSVWSVPSCTRPGVYLVDLADGICTCADTPPAGEVCKHETAATIARAKRRRRVSAAGDPFVAAGHDRPHVCNGGWITLGQLVVDPETGEERERSTRFTSAASARSEARA